MEKTFETNDGETFTTDNPVYIQFIEDMEEAGIEWRTYSGRGMFGKVCPGVTCGYGVTEEDVIDATKVRGLKKDSMGKGTILYCDGSYIK